MTNVSQSNQTIANAITGLKFLVTLPPVANGTPAALRLPVSLPANVPPPATVANVTPGSKVPPVTLPAYVSTQAAAANPTIGFKPPVTLPAIVSTPATTKKTAEAATTAAEAEE